MDRIFCSSLQKERNEKLILTRDLNQDETTKNEIQEQIDSMKNSKSAGLDGGVLIDLIEADRKRSI